METRKQPNHRRIALAATVAGLWLSASCGAEMETAGQESASGISTAADSSAKIAASPDPEPESWLVCDEPVRDFGEVVEGVTLEHRFQFEHRGPEAIEVVSVRTSCGCTSAQMQVELGDGRREALEPGTMIEPGQAVSIDVTYHTQGKAGLLPREVAIYSSQPSGRTVVVLQATVQPWLQIDPEPGDVEIVRSDQVATFEHVVTSTSGERFLLEHVRKAVPDELTVELEPLAADDSDGGRSASWRVVTTLVPGLPRGTYAWPIKLRTDRVHPESPEHPDGTPAYLKAEPTLLAKIVGVVEPDPPRVNFPGVSEGQMIAQTLRLRCFDDGHELGEPVVRLTAPKEGEDWPIQKTATVSTRAVPGENAWDVQVLINGLVPEVDYWFNAKLVIETDHPAAPLIEVPVSGRRNGGWAR